MVPIMPTDKLVKAFLGICALTGYAKGIAVGDIYIAMREELLTRCGNNYGDFLDLVYQR
jgi:hypothetical protein